MANISSFGEGKCREENNFSKAYRNSLLYIYLHQDWKNNTD
jgi:hypothetical protein